MYVIMHYPDEDYTLKPVPLSVHVTQEHAKNQERFYRNYEGYNMYELEIIEVECPDM